jgi:hypothetical protein
MGRLYLFFVHDFLNNFCFLTALCEAVKYTLVPFVASALKMTAFASDAKVVKVLNIIEKEKASFLTMVRQIDHIFIYIYTYVCIDIRVHIGYLRAHLIASNVSCFDGYS